MRKLILILLIIFLGVSPSLSATTQEVEELFIEGKSICSDFEERCEFKTIELNTPLAYTQYRKITIASGIYKHLTKDEVRAILYHELGHALDKHSEQGLAYYNNFYMNNGRYPNAEEMKSFRYEYENKADAIAMYMLLVYKKPFTLDRALIKLEEIYDNGESSNTHPSNQLRINNIKMLENNFRKGIY